MSFREDDRLFNRAFNDPCEEQSRASCKQSASVERVVGLLSVLWIG